MVRLTAAGRADRAFATAPIRIGRCGAAPVALAEDARRRVVVAVAACLRRDDEGTFALVRLRRDGGLDPTFGSGGRAFIRVGGDATYARAEAMLRLANGRLVVAGATIEGGRGPSRVAIARVLPNGRLDRTFGRDGRAYAWVRGIESVNAIFQARLGRLLVAGCADDGPFFVRFNADGSRDRGFWPATNVVRYGGAFGRSCPEFAQTSDNDIVVLGSVLARLDWTGTIEPAFGSIAIPPDRPASALVVLPNDKAYVGGAQAVRGRAFVTLARYSG